MGLVQRQPQGRGQLLDQAGDRVRVVQEPSMLPDGRDLGPDLFGDREIGGVAQQARQLVPTRQTLGDSIPPRSCQPAISRVSRSLWS